MPAWFKAAAILYFDPDRGEYAGALQLEIAGFLSVAAIGLISTKMPDGSNSFSLLIIMTADFGPGIQLSFGFTLLAVGGLLGLNRTVLFQPLLDGVRTNSIQSVMFPQDVIANAPRIISDLRAIFPPQQGTFLIGPMAKIGWGEPTLISLSLGVIIEIPPGDAAILGILRTALPADELPILVLQVNFAGVLEFDKQRFYFFASLFDSHVLFITISGSMGVLFAYGDNANFVLSVGGFHPQFNPPPLPFPAPQRISLDLINESFARIHADGYFAVTTNTVQFGTHSDYFFGFSACNISGSSGFDALIQFSPFHFIAEISTQFSVKVFGVGVYGVGIDVSLSGPTPWHVHGTASLSFFFFSIDIGIDVTWGDDPNTTLPPVAVMPILTAEAQKVSNWKTALPPTTKLLVVPRQLDPAEAALVLHPAGTLQVSQRAIPLDLKLDKVGSQAPSDANQFSFAASGTALTKTRNLQESFAPSQFRNFDDATKLSQPAFVPQDSGLELAGSAALATATAITRPLRYDLTVIDKASEPVRSRFFGHSRAMFTNFLAGNSAGRSKLSANVRSRPDPSRARYQSHTRLSQSPSRPTTRYSTPRPPHSRARPERRTMSAVPSPRIRHSQDRYTSYRNSKSPHELQSAPYCRSRGPARYVCIPPLVASGHGDRNYRAPGSRHSGLDSRRSRDHRYRSQPGAAAHPTGRSRCRALWPRRYPGHRPPRDHPHGAAPGSLELRIQLSRRDRLLRRGFPLALHTCATCRPAAESLDHPDRPDPERVHGRQEHREPPPPLYHPQRSRSSGARRGALGLGTRSFQPGAVGRPERRAGVARHERGAAARTGHSQRES